jgi:hypothetical protein
MIARDEAIRAALKEMRRGGVDIDRAPQAALDLLIDAHRKGLVRFRSGQVSFPIDNSVVVSLSYMVNGPRLARLISGVGFSKG